MKAVPLAIAAVGLAAMSALVGYYGAGSVIESLVRVGAGGFAAICAIHLGLIAVMGLAWRALLPRAPTGPVMWARLVRDSGAEALPLSQVGGYVLGARALALAGVSGTLAAASTIVDVTLEFVAQLAYTALGLAWLVRLQPETRAAAPVLIGLVVAAGAAGLFVLVQRRGYGFVERFAQRICLAIGQGVGKGWAERSAAGAAALHTALAAIYRRPPGLWVNFALHLFCWIASAGEVWLALWLAGEKLPWGAVLAIESLLYAIRTAAFVVPQAVGVQEGAYLLLGAAFGLTPEMALALSLLKRARDLIIGLPAIAVWQAIEGGRLWRRRSVRPGGRLGEMPPGE